MHFKLKLSVKIIQCLNVSLMSFIWCYHRCGHCQRLAPEYEAAATKLKGTLALAKVRSDGPLSSCYPAQSPAFFMLHSSLNLHVLYRYRYKSVVSMSLSCSLIRLTALWTQRPVNVLEWMDTPPLKSSATERKLDLMMDPEQQVDFVSMHTVLVNSLGW